ncbi:MAG: hypothetical protein NC398_01440 [Acetatifactor muris]|nr:hypothetical protein [Acetatifactor muris]
MSAFMMKSGGNWKARTKDIDKFFSYEGMVAGTILNNLTACGKDRERNGKKFK